MKSFCVEQDDVLISIQRILFKEAPTQAIVPVRATGSEAPSVEPRSRMVVPRPESPPPAPADTEWTDPTTGVGSARALRRDLMLEQALPSTTEAALAVLEIDVESLPEIRRGFGSQVALGVLIGVAKAARTVIGPAGKVYRSEGGGLVMLVRGHSSSIADLQSRIESAVSRGAFGADLPPLRLTVRVAGQWRRTETLARR
jgi:GGDEF domain-containing protein